jgi:tetratricopeptide (TPR) repeat protein
MPSGPGERYDFFLSRRGSVATIAREVTDVLKDQGYNVFVQDYDIRFGDSLVEKMHIGIKNSRDLIILFTRDYEQSPYTRKEFTSFEAQRLRSPEQRHIVILLCDDTPPKGLLANNVYQTLVGIEDPEERKSRILAAAERQSQAAPLPPRPFIGVPPRIASFTGREDDLDRLDAILMQDKPAAVTQTSVGRATVQGVGGVGKTSLAVEYAHRFRGLYAGVCWCPSETRTGLLSALAGLAVTLGAATAEEADVEKAAKAALRRLAEQRATWLLVYDNVPAPDHIADLLPCAGARVLITSRFSDWSELADEVALDVLPLEEAVALLESRTGRSDAAGAKTLSEALGCLPLALDHAGAYFKRTQMQFADYAEKASSLIDAAPRGAGYPRSVAATFNLAIAEAVAQCQSAEALMAYLALCAPERIPMTLVEGAIDDEAERLRALTALAEVSLVKHDPFEDGTPAVRVHRLVQAVARARSWAQGEEPTHMAVARLIARMTAIYPQGGDHDPILWPQCAHLTPHLLACRNALSSVTSDNAQWFKFLNSIGWPELLTSAGGYFLGRAAYSQAAPLLRDALAIRENVFGSEHPNTASSLNNLASVLQDLGDFAGARQLFERALAIRENVFGSEHPNTASSLNNLASVLRTEGHFAKARALFERALAIYEKTHGPEHPETASSLNNLATVLNDQGDFVGARQLLERALAIYEKALGPEHSKTVTNLNNLAVPLQAQGDFAGARPLLERALAIREKVLGPEHPETAMSMRNLATLLTSLGDFARARQLLEGALAIYENVLGPEHPETAMSLANLATVLTSQGDFAQARPRYERALAIYERALGPEHSYTNAVRCRLSHLLLRIGAPAEAVALGETALAAHDKVLGRDHAWTKGSARVTADALDALGRTEEAKALREWYGVTEPEKPKSS